MNPQTNQEWAVYYASKGWEVFPIHYIRENGTCSCGMKCGSPGKHPMVNWKTEKTKDERVAQGYWERFPEANIGVATGPGSNLWVLDVDVGRSVELGDGTLVPEGEYALAQLQDQYGDLPATLTSRTGSGGQHWFYTYPAGGEYPNAAGFEPGLDIRGDGGYVVVPPSNHTSGHHYEWSVRQSPVPPPAELVLRAYKERDSHGPGDPLVVESVGEGGRNDWLTRMAGKIRGQADLEEDALFGALMVYNMKHCQPPLSADEVRTIAHSAMRFKPNEPVPEVVWESKATESPPVIPEGLDLAWQIGDFLGRNIDPPLPLVDGLFDQGTGILVAGPPNVGKSWLVMHLGLAVATGTKYLGHYDVSKTSVLIIDEEGHEYGDQQRLSMLVNGHALGSMVNVPLYLTVGKRIKLDNPLGVATIQRMCARYKPGLVIMDSLVRVSDGEENVARNMASFFAVSKELMGTTGAAFLFVHHTKKPGAEPPSDVGDLIRGSSEIRAFVDTALVVLPGDTSTDMHVHVIKQRWKKRPESPFLVRLLTREEEAWAQLGYQGDVVTVDRSAIGTMNRIQSVVGSILQDGRQPTTELIAAWIGLSTSTTRDYLGRMTAMGNLKPIQHGSAFLWFPPEMVTTNGKPVELPVSTSKATLPTNHANGAATLERPSLFTTATPNSNG